MAEKGPKIRLDLKLAVFKLKLGLYIRFDPAVRSQSSLSVFQQSISASSPPNFCEIGFFLIE